MKFTTATILATAGASIASAAPAAPSQTPHFPTSPQFKLVADGGDGHFDGKYVTALHEGAGINYAFINGDEGATFALTHNGVLYQATGEKDLVFAAAIKDESNKVLEFDAIDPDSLADKKGDFGINNDGELTYNGSSDRFYACSKKSDPYNYPGSVITWFTTVEEKIKFSGCHPVAFKSKQ